MWEIIPRPVKSEGKIVLKGRWIDVNKGDDERPIYRSRYVAKEIKKGARSSLVVAYFAAMPPLQGCKFLLILAVTRSFPSLSVELIINDEVLVVGFLDVKRGHFVALARREVYVELPPELQDCMDLKRLRDSSGVCREHATQARIGSLPSASCSWRRLDFFKASPRLAITGTRSGNSASACTVTTSQLSEPW